MSTGLSRVASRFERRYTSFFSDQPQVAFAIRDPHGREHRFGRAKPAFTFAATDDRAMSALGTLDALVIAEAYLSGSLEVEGDLESTLRMRDFFHDAHPLFSAWHIMRPRLWTDVKQDKDHISQHYDFDADFFLTFLDNRHRCYSHGVFQSGDESLEDAMTQKLDYAIEAVGARPGDRVLDVGGGWGAFLEYAGKKDLNVTSLTISKVSEGFLNQIIAREKIPCTVRYQHLHEHKPDKPYDAIVVLGVTEHLPHYRRSLSLYASMLKPGGKIYLDACAMRKKYDVSSFFRRHIYPGNGTPMCLHKYLKAVASSPFSLESVRDDRQSYGLTCRHWAERFDAARAEIERRWGSAQYRKFRLYLWGSYDGFRRDYLQAYRVVLGLPAAATA
jgi:cyclopropane-fatty-acyl-phospholipid synthase